MFDFEYSLAEYDKKNAKIDFQMDKTALIRENECVSELISSCKATIDKSTKNIKESVKEVQVWHAKFQKIVDMKVVMTKMNCVKNASEMFTKIDESSKTAIDELKKPIRNSEIGEKIDSLKEAIENRKKMMQQIQQETNSLNSQLKYSRKELDGLSIRESKINRLKAEKKSLWFEEVQIKDEITMKR